MTYRQHGYTRRIREAGLTQKLLQLTDQRCHGIETDAMQAASQIVRWLRLRKPALNHDLAFGFLR